MPWPWDVVAFASYVADDARLLIHMEPPVEGEVHIARAFGSLFDAFDTSAYRPDYEVVDVHGRTVQFWCRDPEEGWRVSVMLTSRSAPDEPVPVRAAAHG